MFDFDFCKNLFDGENIISLYPNSALTKSCIVKKNNFSFSDHSRVEKYLKRGFTIDFNWCLNDENFKKLTKNGYILLFKTILWL